MNETPENTAYRVTAEELRQIVERIEKLEEEKRQIAEQVKIAYSDAKANGYDPKALRALVRMRKRDKDDIAEEEAVLDMYKEALGM